MNGENPFPIWVRDALICIGLFLAGALLAFGYSYRPLHGALSWRVEQLEERLDERNLENVRLSDALAKQKSNETTRVDPETLAQVERELVQTKRVLNQAEKDLKRANRKRKESTASASKWRKRFEDLRDQPAAVAVVAPTPTRTPNSESAPAAPAVSSPDPNASNSSGGSQASPKRGILSPAETTGSADP